MPNPESQPSHDTFREIEAEFHTRPDYRPVETTPPLITMPSEVEFAQLAAEREAREAAEREKRIAAHKEWLEREKRQKWKNRMKKAMAVVALTASVKSGGFIDMAGDQFSDAGRVAAEAVEAPSLADHLPQDEVDGIAFEDYPQAAQDEMTAEAHATVENIEQARNTVIELFETADRDGYDGIVREVAEHRAAHPELFMDQNQVEAVTENIENASSNEDAIQILQEFMNFYGIEAGFHDQHQFDDRQGEVKEIARAYVDVFSVLPKDFIALSKLEQVTVSNKPVTTHATDGGGSEMGVYRPNENVINVVAVGKVLNAVMPVEGFLQRTDYSYQGVVAHELGHAFDEQLPVEVSQPEGEQVEGVSAATFLEHMARGVINRPEAPSVYAHSADEEYSAELKSGVLSDRSDGLASTDEWRKFGSESNKAMIATLVKFERVYPGIAKILIANRA